MNGSMIEFLKDQHLRTGILYIMGCVRLFARGMLRNLLLEFSTEIGLQEHARLLYDCAALALPGDLLPYVVVALSQIVHDKLYISTNKKTERIGFGNSLCWNGVYLVCVCACQPERAEVCA